MPSVIGKNFAIYDLNEFPTTMFYRKDGNPLRDRKMLISPHTTGEPITILITESFPTKGPEPLPSKEQLLTTGHKHEFATEIMIRRRASIGCALDGTLFDLPAGSAYVAKAGCYHSSANVDSTLGNSILCIFPHALPEDEDDNYVELYRLTKEYLATVKRV